MSKTTMNVSLTPELEKIVQDMVGKGLFASNSEVVRAAIRLLNEKEQEYQANLEKLRSEIRVGVEQAIRGEGEYLSADDFKARGRAALAAKRAETDESELRTRRIA